jgi:signal transduction histidine kinase
MSNAAKFTEQGRIEMGVRRSEQPRGEREGAWISFTVADTGIGMDPERIETAFKAFDQLDPSTTRKYGGTGLGLAISRHYCEMMGGDISVESKLGEGSIFSVRLPARVKNTFEGESVGSNGNA